MNHTFQDDLTQYKGSKGHSATSNKVNLESQKIMEEHLLMMSIEIMS